MTHTKGPWTHTHPVYYADEYEQISGPDNELVACYVMPANARLIAAAPELLEACESVVACIVDCYMCDGSGLEHPDETDDACRVCGGVGKVLNGDDIFAARMCEEAICKAKEA